MDGTAITDLPTPRRHPLRELFDPGLVALRRLWKPFVAIQLCGLAVVIGYFSHDGFARWCDRLGEMKASAGLLFPMIGMAIASGFVPEVFKFVTGVDRRLDTRRLEQLLYTLGVFALIGLIVNGFYNLLAWLFDGATGPAVVVGKVLIDQFIFTPFISLPFMALVFTFQRLRYRPIATIRALGLGWYRREVGPLLVVCWAYWIPMCTLMFALPVGLTFLFGMCASAASATILVAVARRDVER